MRASALIWLTLLAAPCGCDDDDGTAADRIGVGAACSSDAPCPEVERDGEPLQLSCLSEFRAGYCGIRDCQDDADCPDGSACVAHDDGTRYCFRICAEKIECNRNRSVEDESNCSSNIEFVNAQRSTKACVPPSSGT